MLPVSDENDMVVGSESAATLPAERLATRESLAQSAAFRANRIPMPHRIQLLQRPACLLCLEAEYLLMQAGIDTFERVDIEREPALEQRYGHFIPVLRDGAGRELPWPFTLERLRDWLAGSTRTPAPP